MKHFISLLFLITVLLVTKAVFSQGVAINSDGAEANPNAVLDIESPSDGDGLGLLIPRVTEAQRTTSSSSLAGGLLSDGGELRGGTAQGLLVYQTDGAQGFYYNTSTGITPAWVYLEKKSLPIGGSNVAVGDNATSDNNGVAVGVSANGQSYGVAVGQQANGNDSNVAIGYLANGYAGAGPYAGSVVIGYRSNSFTGNGADSGGVAIGYRANARHNFNEDDSGAVSVGWRANSFIRGVALGYNAIGYNQGTAVGYEAFGYSRGVAVGYAANGYYYGTALGFLANSGNTNYSLAKGAYSKCMRYNEEWKSSDGYDNKFGYGQVNFHGVTTTNLSTELFLGGATNQRFILDDNSSVSFSMLVTGVNQDTGDSSVWRIWGGIKRRNGAATTSMIGSVSIDAKEQGGLTTNPIISADTANGSLRVQVTGVSSNSVQFNAAMTYSEVRENSQ